MKEKTASRDNVLNGVSFEILSYLLIDNSDCAIFNIKLDENVLTNPVSFIFHDFESLGIDGEATLESLINHIDPKSEICEVKGVNAYHREVKNDITSEVRKTTTYIPLKIGSSTKPYELKLVRIPEEGNMMGVIMELDDSSYNIEKLYGDSYKDQMTGLFNKNALDYHFAKNTEPHYIGFMDIDYFKSYNDRYSHSSGDRLLAQVGAKLISIADPTVIFYRHGGDEFVFMTNHLDYQGTLNLIKKIQKAVSEVILPNSEKLTMSIGFAYSDGTIKDYGIFDALLLADYAMYKSKACSSSESKVHYVSPTDACSILKEGSIQKALDNIAKQTKRKSI